MQFSGRGAARPRRPRRFHPAQVIFGAFTAATLAGTGLLLLPFAKADPGSATWVESLFTAVSALAVTGHIVVDTPTYWTPFGQVVILVLIQLGELETRKAEAFSQLR